MATKSRNQSEDARAQMVVLMQALQGYDRGNARLTSLDNNSVTKPANANATPRVDPVKTQSAPTVAGTNNTAISAQRAAQLASLAASIMGSPEAARAINATAQGARIADPNTTTMNKVQAGIGLAGTLSRTPVGPYLSALNMVQQGPSVSNVLGLLSTTNPVLGLLGGLNNITGNPIGALGNTFGNQQSMSAAEAAGVSNLEQAYNAVNTNQQDKDIAAMDRLMAALAGTEFTRSGSNVTGTGPDNNSGPGVRMEGNSYSGWGGDRDGPATGEHSGSSNSGRGGGGRRGDGMGDNGGRGSSGMGSARGPGED